MARLIDADDLKKDLRQYFTDGVLDGVSAKLVFNQILHDIDDAPTVEPERPQGECEKCDFRKFTEKFIDGVIEVMNKNGITSIEQLSEILKGGAE